MSYENILPHNAQYAFEVSGFPYQSIYEVSTVQRYMIGARYHEAWSGRTFKYALAAEALTKNFMAQNTLKVAYEGTADAAFAIGVSKVVLNAGTYPAVAPSFTEDQLIGGYIHWWTDPQQGRIITANTATDTNTTVTMDYPLTVALVADTSSCEMHYNPYGAVGFTNDENRPNMGLPTVPVAVGEYCWLQTWGYCWLNPYQAAVGGAGASEKQFIFVGNGSVGDHHINVSTKGYQHAGFGLDNTTDYESTFAMLQICP